MAQPDYYHILGVRPMADRDAIKRAYRDKIRQHHPDRFAAERARLQQSGDQAGLHALERRISEAHKQTQRINEAYAILSDPTRRDEYDRQRSGRADNVYTGAYADEDYDRRTGRGAPGYSTSRTTAPPRQPTGDSLPWFALAGLILMVLFGAWVVSSLLGAALSGGGQRVSAARGTPSVLQITEQAREATSVVRTATARQPTATPRSPDDHLQAADTLLEMGYYDLALAGYDAAYDAFRYDATFYFRRGQAYAGLADGRPGDAAAAALVNFDRALYLQPDDVTVRRARGLLNFMLWQASDDEVYADAALQDLLLISERDSDDTIEAAILALGATTP